MSLGPKIVRQEAPYRPVRAKRNRDTGIRQSNTGEWCAIRNGEFSGSFGPGLGGRRLAARAAGSSVVI